MADGNGSFPSTFTSLAMSVAQGGKLDAGAVTRALGSQVFDQLIVDSDMSPEVALEPWAPGEPDAPANPLPSLLGNFVRPRARLMRQGKTLMTFAPFGEPSGTWLPKALGVGGGIVAITSFLLGHKAVAWKAAMISAGGFAWGYMQARRAAP